MCTASREVRMRVGERKSLVKVKEAIRDACARVHLAIERHAERSIALIVL
jgi:hypothetical protein